jgi:DNA-binding CsgD family transcriptional regulator/N-acetylneuraminic acid mutarotase
MTGPDPTRPIDLTPREREVLAMVAEGKTNREIGSALYISESTAGVHVSNILAKLGVASRTEAAAIAIKSGLFEGTPAEAAASEVLPEPTYVQPQAPVATGWRARLQAQMRRHPRSTAIVGGSVVVLAAITMGLAFAVLTSDRPSGAIDASSTPIAAADGSVTPTATAALETPSPTPSSSATPSASSSASASPSASGTPSPATTQAPVAAPTPSPNVTWTAAGGGIDGRGNHTATVLSDDSVLIIGGATITAGGCVATVIRYHPATDRWTDEEPMDHRHCGHTATLLSDGTILVVGGNSGTAPTSAVERFNPASGTWTAAAGMAWPRFGHTATLLSDGRVLVVGGKREPEAALPEESAEVYDPATGSWTQVQGPVDPRADHTATRLPDGSVLVAGGVRGCCGTLASAELYDPTSGTWSSAARMVQGRMQASGTMLADGRFLVAGGTGPASTTAIDSAEIYDPSEDRWTATAPMTESRVMPTLTVLESGRVIAWGGTSGDLPTAEMFDPASGAWRFDGRLPFSLSSHTATLLEDATILVVGARDYFAGNDLMGTIRYIPLEER